MKPGPLLNPDSDFWFSDGFIISPTVLQSSQPYVPSSGGQLVEFVPSALSPVIKQGSGDTAEIGVGPNAPNSCFRFNFYGASLGCEADGVEQWCEFEISAYSVPDDGTITTQPIAWSETQRVPACPNFSTGGCPLIPVDFEGYTNISSILITLHVGTDLRVWWGDDFRVGWTDNSCLAAACRANPDVRRVKRKEVISTVRRGVWHWSPFGLQRFDDDLIWDAAEQ